MVTPTESTRAATEDAARLALESIKSDAFNNAFLAAGIVMLIVLLGEVLHIIRVQRVAALAFGPEKKFLPLAFVTILVRTLGFTALAWAFTMLAFWPAKSHPNNLNDFDERDFRHLVLVLDVSPSMQLKDAGPNGTQSRAARAADLIQSFYDRVNAEKYKTTVIAFYTGAKPVVKDTYDREVVRNILTELPMRHAFKMGETNLFAGLEEAAKIAKPWNPGSAILMVVTDGDTLPTTGMPKMPASIGSNVVIVGVGSPTVGQSIAGHSSKQDVSTLRQTAIRLNGNYHDGNDKQLSTTLVSSADEKATPKKEDKLEFRDYALMAIPIATVSLTLWYALLTMVGTGWNPGHRPRFAQKTHGIEKP
ncbi:MAG: vWA domain-containing protein [Fimbriiglobus sp.]